MNKPNTPEAVLKQFSILCENTPITVEWSFIYLLNIDSDPLFTHTAEIKILMYI